MATDRLAEARRERDFLLSRSLNPSAKWVGLSSDAMVRAAITSRVMPDPSSWPADKSDLSRCVVTYLRAPSHLKPIMAPWLAKYARHVAIGGLYCVGCDTSGHGSTAGNLCPLCRQWIGTSRGD